MKRQTVRFQKTMVDTLASLLPVAVLVSHIVFVVLLLSIIFRNSWGKSCADWFGRHAVAIAFIFALAAAVGSLFYSEVIGYEPCILCWWQRVFLYPSVLLLGIAFYKKDKAVFGYVVPLVAIAALIAFYQYYSTFLGGGSFLACTDEGGACSKVYVNAFGYITIEFMSLTTSLFILLLAWAKKIYDKNSNSR